MYQMEIQMPYTITDIRMILDTNPDAAMRAVCAIFRNQTDYEKSVRATVNKNGCGFRANHAKAGSDLALWMTRGNNDGIMRRRVGGTAIYNGREVSRVWLAYEIAGWYAEQLATIANQRMEDRDRRWCEGEADIQCEEYYCEENYEV